MSLCRAGDPDRRVKFERVCRHIGAEGIICDVDDGNPLGEIDPAAEIGGRIIKHLGGREWDLCLTHGANGEYGHRRHRQIHRQVLRLAEAGELRCRRLWTFSYVCHDSGQCAAAGDADVKLPLSDEQLREKKRIMHEMYGYGRDSFEVSACTSPEGFDRRFGPPIP